MVDPELFEDYRKAMETVARLAHDATSALVADIDPFGDPTQNALRLLAGYPEIVARYGTVAVTAAREYYERSRERAVESGEVDADDYEAVDAPTVRREWAEEDVRKAAGEGIDQLAGEAVRRVMQRGDQTIAMNAMRDPAHPMWAIVPHAGACGWCVMVASNGWAYSSERSANAQRHANCKCTVAVDFDLGNPSLRGYDPDALYGRYRRGIADAGGEGGIRARWDALSPEERARYKRKGRSAYDVFKTKEITKAMDAAAGPTHGKGVPPSEAGGMYGAWNNRNDPTGKKRNHHAIRYYEELRNRDEDAEVRRTSDNTGIGEAVVRQAYRHIFVDRHDLDKGYDRFDENYDMAESWRRISTGADIQPHDLTLVYHEAIEDDFMYMLGMPYRRAHDMTCDMGYDWAKECDEWKRVNGLL